MSLLDAICAAPDDDAPRLVHGGCLLESDDDFGRIRGELTIAQCTRAKEPMWSDAWQRARATEKRLVPLVRARDDGEQGFRVSFATRKEEQRIEVTLGELGWARRAFLHVRRFLVTNAEGGLTLRAALLPVFHEDDATLAWPDRSAPHTMLRGGHASRDRRHRRESSRPVSRSVSSCARRADVARRRCRAHGCDGGSTKPCMRRTQPGWPHATSRETRSLQRCRLQDSGNDHDSEDVAEAPVLTAVVIEWSASDRLQLESVGCTVSEARRSRPKTSGTHIASTRVLSPRRGQLERSSVDSGTVRTRSAPRWRHARYARRSRRHLQSSVSTSDVGPRRSIPRSVGAKG